MRSSVTNRLASAARLLLLAAALAFLTKARASLLTLGFTNALNQPDTNLVKVFPLNPMAPVYLGNGQIQTYGGLPLLWYPASNGQITNWLPTGNWFITNADLGTGFAYRSPDNSSNFTAYPLSGLGVFQTVVQVSVGTNLASFIAASNVIPNTGPLSVASITSANSTFTANSMFNGPAYMNNGLILNSFIAGNVDGAGLVLLSLGAMLTNSFETGGYYTNGSYAGNGANLTAIAPANISAGTAGISITGNAATATSAISATQAAGATIATNVVYGINITNPIETSGTYTGGTYGGNGVGMTNLNNSFSTPVLAADQTGQIAINANPTSIGNPVGFSPPNPNYTAQGGEVILIGNAFDNASGNAALAIDGNLATSDAGASPGFIGQHATNACFATRVRLAPQPSCPYSVSGTGFPREQCMNGVSYGTCANTSFGTPVSYGTTPGTPVPPVNYWMSRYQLTEFTNGFPTASSSYFCLGFTNVSSYLEIGEMQWIVVGTTIAMPVSPMISPWGGFTTNGTAIVTMSTISTAASIYYTLDGSTPTGPSHGTLYTNPFVLNCSANLVATNPLIVKSIAYEPALLVATSTVSTAYFYGTGYIPLVPFWDQNGNVVDAHGGGIIDDTANGHGFLWYGDSCNVGQNSINGNNSAGSIGTKLYQSSDLMHWNYMGFAWYTPDAGITSCYHYRPHVAFNPLTHQYIGVEYRESNSIVYCDALLTSSTPTGPFTYKYPYWKPFGGTSTYGDENLSVYNGGCYFIQNSNPSTGGVWKTQLDPTWTTNVGPWALITPNYREAPAEFYIPAFGFDDVLSLGNFYDWTTQFSLTNYQCAGSNPLGSFSLGNSLFAVNPLNGGSTPTNLFNFQSTGVFISPWTGQPVLMGDQWYNGSTPYWNPILGAYSTTPTINPNDGTNATLAMSGYVFEPLTVNNTNVTCQTNLNWWLPQWNKPFEQNASITLGTLTPIGFGCDLFNSNGVLYFINTSTGHTNYVCGP